MKKIYVSIGLFIIAHYINSGEVDNFIASEKQRFKTNDETVKKDLQNQEDQLNRRLQEKYRKRNKKAPEIKSINYDDNDNRFENNSDEKQRQKNTFNKEYENALSQEDITNKKIKQIINMHDDNRENIQDIVNKDLQNQEQDIKKRLEQRKQGRKSISYND